MKYTDMKNLPGPGDEETWGPCTGHPMDPRTEDVFSEDEIEEKRLEMMQSRMEGNCGWTRAEARDWVRDAFSEADYEKLSQLKLLATGEGNPTKVVMLGLLVREMLEEYVMPTDEEAVEALTEERSDDRA